MAAPTAMGILLHQHQQQQPSQQASPRPQQHLQKQAIQGQASGSIRPLTLGPVGAAARLAGRTPSGTALYQIPRNVLDLSQPLDLEQQGLKHSAAGLPTKKRPSPAAPSAAKPSAAAAAAAAAARAGWSPAASPLQTTRSSKQEPKQLTRQASTGMDEAMAAHALLNMSQQARRSDDSAAAGSSRQWRGLRDAAPSSSGDMSPAGPRSRQQQQQEEAGYGPNKASRLHMMGAPGSSSRSQRQQQGRPQQQQPEAEEALPRQQHKWGKQQQWLLKAGLLVEGGEGQPDQGSQVLWRKWVAVLEAHNAGFTQEAMHMAMQLGAHTATFLQARGEDPQDIQNMGIGLTALCVSTEGAGAGAADGGWWAAAPAAAGAAHPVHPQPHQQQQQQQHLQHDRLQQLRTAGGEGTGAAQPGTPQKLASGSTQPAALVRALAARSVADDSTH